MHDEVHNEMNRKVTTSTKLQGTQRSPKLALRSTDFHAPENLNFPALQKNIIKKKKKRTNESLNFVLVMFDEAFLTLTTD